MSCIPVTIIYIIDIIIIVTYCYYYLLLLLTIIIIIIITYNYDLSYIMYNDLWMWNKTKLN
jgi:hypothetical protein